MTNIARCIAVLFFASGSVYPACAQTLPREVNVTTDSAPGWIPTEEQDREAIATLQTYFGNVESGRLKQAYDAWSPGNQALTPYNEFAQSSAAFNADAGAFIARRILKVTWTKDPANAPGPGVYAAIDVSARYRNIDRQCGYLILFQQPGGGPFKIMRIENNYMLNSDAGPQPNADADRAWAALSSRCPNYQPD